MCVPMDRFEKLVETVNRIDKCVIIVEKDTKDSLNQLKTINGRVGVVEKELAEIEKDKAARFENCPFRTDIEKNNNYIIRADSVKASRISSRNEFRLWGLFVISLIGAYLAFFA